MSVRDNVSSMIKRITNNKDLGVYVFTKQKLNCIYYMSKLNQRIGGVRYCGVYWLYDGDEIVYIGYSENVLSRVKQHGTPLSNKVWNKAKIIILPDKATAKGVETTLLWNFTTRYNSPKYKLHGSLHGSKKKFNGLISINAYKKFKSDINFALRIYGEYCDMKREDIEHPGVIDMLDKIDSYRKYINLSFEEYDEHFKRRVRGEEHNMELFTL